METIKNKMSMAGKENSNWKPPWKGRVWCKSNWLIMYIYKKSDIKKVWIVWQDQIMENPVGYEKSLNVNKTQWETN